MLRIKRQSKGTPCANLKLSGRIQAGGLSELLAELPYKTISTMLVIAAWLECFELEVQTGKSAEVVLFEAMSPPTG